MLQNKKELKRDCERMLSKSRVDRAYDDHICPGGKILVLQAKRFAVDGTICRRYVSDGKYCQHCSLKCRCLVKNLGLGICLFQEAVIAWVFQRKRLKD